MRNTWSSHLAKGWYIGGAGGSCLCMMANSPKLAVPSDSEALCPLGVGRAVDSSQGSGFFFGDGALSVGMAQIMGSFSATSNMVIFNRLLLLSRGVKHLWSSFTATHSVPGGIPNCVAHH